MIQRRLSIGFRVGILLLLGTIPACGGRPWNPFLNYRRYSQTQVYYHEQPSRFPVQYLDELRDELPTTARARGTAPELVIHSGHAHVGLGETKGLAVSPDGRLLATGGLDGKLCLWDLESGTELRAILAHADEVTAVAFDPSGERVVTGSEDKTVKVWDVRTSAQRLTIEIAPYALSEVAASMMGQVVDLAYSPDGAWLGITADSTVRICDANSGEERHLLFGHQDDVLSLCFHPAGELLASADKTGVVKEWSVETGGLVSSSHVGPSVRTVAYDSSGEDLGVLVPDKPNRLVLRRAGAGAGGRGLFEAASLSGLAFHPDGKRVAVSGSRAHGGGVWVLDLESGAILAQMDEPVSASRLVFSPDGSRLFCSGSVTREWEVATGRVVRDFGAQTLAITSVGLSPDSKTLMASSWPNRVDFWRMEAGSLERQYTVETPNWRAESSPDLRWKAGFSMKDKEHDVVIADLESDQPLAKIRIGDHIGWHAAFSPDSSLLAVVDTEENLSLIDPLEHRVLRSWKSHEKSDTYSLAFSSDSKRIATGHSPFPEEIRIWSVESGELLTTIKLQDLPRALTFGPDGRLIACIQSLINFRSLEVFDSRSGELICAAVDRAPNGSIGIAFSPDGTHVLMGCADGALCILNVETGKAEMLEGHSGPVTGIRFAPNGRILVTGSEDGSTRLWDFQRRELLATMIATNAGDWVVVTPDGLFDGSPEAWKALAWRFGGDTFDLAPIESFFQEFYYPRLVPDLMAGLRPRAPSELASKDRRQPRVEIRATGEVIEGQVEVEVVVAEAPPDEQHTQGSGARDLRLFCNGSLVRAWRGSLGPEGAGDRVRARVPIVAGSNRLGAYAFNDEDVKSADAALTIDGPSSLARRGELTIVAVGIDQYENSAFDLSFAVADASAFASELRREQVELDRYDVRVLSLTNQQAVRSRILETLDSLARELRPEDALVVYFAGHGIAHEDRFYLLPHDIGYGGAPTELAESALSELTEGWISDEELELAFEPIHAGHLLFVIDACNSGQILEAEEARRGPMNSRGLAQLAYEKGMHVLAASQAFQVAQESPILGHGFLTYALVQEGLNTEAADSRPHDSVVVLREWLDYAVERVPQLQLELTGERTDPSRGIEVIGNSAMRARVEAWNVQSPRVFYRRYADPDPLVVSGYGVAHHP